MLRILELTVPFFVLVLCGCAAVRRGWLPRESIPALNLFVLYFGLPCMLFRFGVATPIARMLDPGIFGVYLLCALGMVGVGVVSTRRGRVGWNDASFGALVAAFPNSGFMGVPLLVALLGERAAPPAIVALAVDMVVTSSLCIALSRLGERRGAGGGVAVAGALKGMVANPLPWSIGLGCAVSASGLQLPAVLLRPVFMMADAASPVALFTLGALLARTGVRASAGTAARRDGDVPRVVALKLVLHPALVWGTARLAIAAGVPLEPFAATVLTLVAALPSASNVPMLAERFGADGTRIARVVLFSTVASFLSFSWVAAVLT